MLVNLKIYMKGTYFWKNEASAFTVKKWVNSVPSLCYIQLCPTLSDRVVSLVSSVKHARNNIAVVQSFQEDCSPGAASSPDATAEPRGQALCAEGTRTVCPVKQIR